MGWSNPHPGNPDSLRWVKSFWDKKFIVIFLQLTQKISLGFNKLFEKSIVQTFFLPGSTFLYIKTKHIFNTIVHSHQTQLVPPTVLHWYFYHTFFPPHVFFRLRRYLKQLSPLTCLNLQDFNNFNYDIIFSCDTMNHIVISPLNATQVNTQ